MCISTIMSLCCTVYTLGMNLQNLKLTICILVEAIKKLNACIQFVSIYTESSLLKCASMLHDY